MYAFLGSLVGGLIVTFLISRALHETLFSTYPVPKKFMATHFVTLLIATILAGFGFAQDGAPNFGMAFIFYAPAVFIWLAVDWIRWHLKKRAG